MKPYERRQALYWKTLDRIEYLECFAFYSLIAFIGAVFYHSADCALLFCAVSLICQIEILMSKKLIKNLTNQ